MWLASSKGAVAVLTIVGGGVGRPQGLTQAALEALEKADQIWVEPLMRELVQSRAEWAAKAQERAPDWWPTSEDWRDRNVAWLVPDTPALYSPLRDWLYALDPAVWPQLAVISGVSRALGWLDERGLVLPPWTMELASLDHRVRLAWNGDAWVGDETGRAVAWGPPKPLLGRVVMLLRQGSRTGRAVRWLEDWGARVLVAPVSILRDPPSWDPVDHAIRHLGRYDWVIFTSQEAVQRWFERQRLQNVDIRAMRAKIAVVGPETAVAVRERGLIPELMPEEDFSQEGLMAAFREIPMRGSAVLLPGGQLNRTVLADDLRARGALVDAVVLYQNLPAPLPADVVERIRTRQVDAVIFTAASQVEYLCEQLTPEDLECLAGVASFSIGPLTTRALSRYGLVPAQEAPEPSLRLLTELVRDYFLTRAESF
ncbi:MAG: bifunctional uroporphyrinogen-III C-methyltransferase/uroporphyrinogen-III synthase [Firmicutes bacterium]|nr:bifunctional uroporphyrinogen-III C-methyltransferase/uroporphyrinogen-III synthase [Bacillota bacterium]